MVSGLKQGLLLGAALVILLLPPGGRTPVSPQPVRPGQGWPNGPNVSAQPVSPLDRIQPEFGAAVPSPDARQVAGWVARSQDNQSLPFAILDKRGARLYVFDARARLLGTSLVLLGSALGDDSVAGIGHRPLSEIRADERTTAAGRFISQPGHDQTGEAVVWVDYDSSLAMHRVKVVDPKERRFERIATESIADKRISNGCINVPIRFYDSVVQPVLGRSRAVVYVLPEIKPLRQVFQAVYAAAGRQQLP